MVLIDAVYINNGGGLVLLKYLIEIFHNIDIVCEIDNETQIYNDEKRIK